MQEYVTINSTRNITVTAGLQCHDRTNRDSDIPNRLRISPVWPKLSVLIRAGVGTYPREIMEWPTVQALIKDKVLTVTDNNPAPTAEAKAKAEELDRVMEEEGLKTNDEPAPEISESAPVEEAPRRRRRRSSTVEETPAEEPAVEESAEEASLEDLAQ